MIIRFVGAPIETAIYLLCVITSLLCAWLLARAYLRGRTKLLVWSAICFALLALNNLVLTVDILLLPANDLSILRVITALLAVGVLLVRLHLGSLVSNTVVDYLAGMVTADILPAGCSSFDSGRAAATFCSSHSPPRFGCWP